MPMAADDLNYSKQVLIPDRYGNMTFIRLTHLSYPNYQTYRLEHGSTLGPLSVPHSEYGVLIIDPITKVLPNGTLQIPYSVEMREAMSLILRWCKGGIGRRKLNWWIKHTSKKGGFFEVTKSVRLRGFKICIRSAWSGSNKAYPQNERSNLSLTLSPVKRRNALGGTTNLIPFHNGTN